MPHGDVRTLRDWLDDTAGDLRRHLFGRTEQQHDITVHHSSAPSVASPQAGDVRAEQLANRPRLFAMPSPGGCIGGLPAGR